jgi:hypothetical protein
MGVPTSEIGYISVTTRRETMKSMTDMWWHWKTTTTTTTTTIVIHKHYVQSKFNLK